MACDPRIASLHFGCMLRMYYEIQPGTCTDHKELVYVAIKKAALLQGKSTLECDC